ncbi:hypothetical protein AKO1_015838 [Acrasis kona]|uniref:Uncharacterized protein n=1 Tax=Acrasis kona TaxID=1008807 RepID=A0AAW2ZJ98_9EUKA
MNGTTNADISKRVKGSTGDIPYTITDDSKLELQLTPEKSLCFNPSVSIVGFSAFIAFNYPVLPISLSTGISLVQQSGSSTMKSLVTFPPAGQHTLKLDSDTSSITDITLQQNTDYLLLVGADIDVSYIQTSVIDMKKNIVGTVINYITDGTLVDAIFTDKYYICVTTNSAARSMNAASNGTMLLSYFGSQNRSVLVTNSTITPTSRPSLQRLSPGAIAGILIGVIAFVAAVVCVIIIVLIIVFVSRRNKKKVPIGAISQDVKMNSISP